MIKILSSKGAKTPREIFIKTCATTIEIKPLLKKNFSSGWECISLEDWNCPVFAPSLYFFLWTFDLGHLGHCSLSPHVLYFILRLIDAIKKKQDHISHSPPILGNATYHEQNMICSIIV